MLNQSTDEPAPSTGQPAHSTGTSARPAAKLAQPAQNPGYRDLRLGADLASSIRGTPVFFNFQQGELTITDPHPDSVPVETAPSAARRPQVTGVTLEVDGYERLTLDAKRYSALFWSESAVEKFLLPYYASAAGPRVHEFLYVLHHVWYGYRDDVRVCALAFAYPAAPFTGPQQLWDTVEVIFCPPAQADLLFPLRSMPLLQFFNTLPAPALPVLPPDISLIRGERAPLSDQATCIDSVGSREAAEYVSGLRGHTVRVYQDPNVPGGLKPVLEPKKLDDPLLFDASTVPVRDYRPRVTVKLELEGMKEPYPLQGKPGDPTTWPDSVFWTDGAVDMLLVPYYASVQAGGAPWYLLVLLGKWAGWIPCDCTDAAELRKHVSGGAERTPRRRHERGPAPGHAAGRLEGETAGDAGPTDSEVFAIVHLPRSEYVDDGTGAEPFFLENRTMLHTPGGAFPLVAPGDRLVP